MSYDQAVAAARDLRMALLDHGVRAVSIELVEGRGGSGWHDDRFVGTMGHHIASRRSQGDTPGLNLVKKGRADLPGPLCGGYGGFDEIARIICVAWANHPGAGGPYTLPAGTIPANNGRPYLFGWEFEGGLDIADFTDSYRLFMARCLAGTLDWLGQPIPTAHIEHKTWAPGRKVDRLGYTLDQARQEIIDSTPAPEVPVFLPISQKHVGERQSDIGLVAGMMNDAFGLTLPEDGSWGDEMVAAVDEHLPGTDGKYLLAHQYRRLLAAFNRATASGGGNGIDAALRAKFNGHKHSEGVTSAPRDVDRI